MGNRARRHPGHFKRQQSSPVVLYTQNGKKMYPNTNESLNNNFMNSANTNKGLERGYHSTVLDMDPCPCTKSSSKKSISDFSLFKNDFLSDRSFEFLKLFKHFKSNKNLSAPQSNKTVSGFGNSAYKFSK